MKAIKELIEGWTCAGLIRFHVLFVVKVATRRIHIAGINLQPHGAWMEQLARNWASPVGGFLSGCRTLIRDCDSLSQRALNPLCSQRE